MRNAETAKRVEDLFHDGMQFSLAKLGYPNLELKKEQYDVLERYAWTKLCVLNMLPTGCVVKDRCWADGWQVKFNPTNV